METAHLDNDGRVPESPTAAAPGDPGTLEHAQALWHDLRGLAHDHLRLAALETQRAGESLIDMVGYVVAAAILLVSAWLGLTAAGILWLIAGGLDASAALLLAAALEVAAALVLFAMIRRSSRYLRFPATVRSLRSDASMLAPPDRS